MRLIRELFKTIMFIMIWTFPIYLTVHFSDARYLICFGISFVMTVSIFSHYENLEKIDLTDKLIDHEETQEDCKRES